MNTISTTSPLTEARLHQAFIITVALNAIIALLDIAAGFFFAYKPLIDPYLFALTTQPGVVARISHLAINMSGHVQAIGAFYFFSHGAVKLFLVWGLWQARLWAYPVSILFLAGFSLYQLYEIMVAYSFVVAAFLLFNIVVIILIGKEYRRVTALTILARNTPTL